VPLSPRLRLTALPALAADCPTHPTPRPTLHPQVNPTEFVGYTDLEGSGTIVGLLVDGKPVQEAHEGASAGREVCAGAWGCTPLAQAGLGAASAPACGVRGAPRPRLC
jgi:hypothetical protein